MVGTLAGLALALALQPSPTEPPDHELPVSFERIRAALQTSGGPPLILTERRPDFRVDINERRFWSDSPKAWQLEWIPPAPPGGLYGFEQRQRLGQAWQAQPLVSIELLSISRASVAEIRKAQKARAERAAREEVRQALAAFCAANSCE